MTTQQSQKFDLLINAIQQHKELMKVIRYKGNHDKVVNLARTIETLTTELKAEVGELNFNRTMAQKMNQRSLNEEIQKFKLISEYTFYTEEPKDDTDDLILGASGLAEVDDDPNDVPDAGDDSKTNGETPAADPAAVPPPPVPDAAADAPDMDAEPVAIPPPPPAETEAPPLPPPDSETGGDEVEVDVTALVKGSEEAKQSADDASQNTSTLLSKFQDLERRVGAMAQISSKIETLEKEIIKRNPTPIETLEMRSMSSFPYNIKLTDYWKDVDGYDPTGEQIEKEYTLTQDEVDSDFSDSTVKKSFDEEPEGFDYEEEDI